MASKPNPFAGFAAKSKAPAFGKAKPFEKSKGDKEAPRFGKEGSKKEEAMDKKQGMPAFKCGGKVKK